VFNIIGVTKAADTSPMVINEETVILFDELSTYPSVNPFV
jgi:hypothetical protein